MPVKHTSEPVGASKWRRPRVSSYEPLREAALRFCPPYELLDESRGRLRIKLRDPQGRRPDLSLSHRNERRLFLKANYLHIGCTVPGDGPPVDGKISFKFRGWFSRQRAVAAWTHKVPGGEEWLHLLRDPLGRGVEMIQAVQLLRIDWSVRRQVWRLDLETLSGSMMSGITAMLPIAVPFDREEATGVIAVIDALAATRG
jgi:hypothetical protein